jgi:hypothetical protein
MIFSFVSSKLTGGPGGILTKSTGQERRRRVFLERGVLRGENALFVHGSLRRGLDRTFVLWYINSNTLAPPYSEMWTARGKVPSNYGIFLRTMLTKGSDKSQDPFSRYPLLRYFSSAFIARIKNFTR